MPRVPLFVSIGFVVHVAVAAIRVTSSSRHACNFALHHALVSIAPHTHTQFAAPYLRWAWRFCETTATKMNARSRSLAAVKKTAQNWRQALEHLVCYSICGLSFCCSCRVERSGRAVAAISQHINPRASSQRCASDRMTATCGHVATPAGGSLPVLHRYSPHC